MEFRYRFFSRIAEPTVGSHLVKFSNNNQAVYGFRSSVGNPVYYGNARVIHFFKVSG